MIKNKETCAQINRQKEFILTKESSHKTLIHFDFIQVKYLKILTANDYNSIANQLYEQNK